MRNYTNSSPSFSQSIPVFETTDRGHADVFNRFAIPVFENTLSLKKSVNSLEQSLQDAGELVSEETVQSMIDGTYVPGQHNSSGGGSSGGSASDDDIASDEDIADILNGLYG